MPDTEPAERHRPHRQRTWSDPVRFPGRQPRKFWYSRVYDPATGAVTPRKVTVGLNNKITAEVTSGLEEGDAVVSTTRSATTGSTAATGARTGGGLRFGGPGFGG